MDDLQAISAFDHLLRSGGFSATARTTGIPKSKQETIASRPHLFWQYVGTWISSNFKENVMITGNCRLVRQGLYAQSYF
jgi:hypothetical protein